jgi:putative endonuclease
MSEILSLSIQDNHLAAVSPRKVGEIGEELAARFLEKQDYRLVLANFKVPIGRNRRGVSVTGEIDLIALDEEVLCFIEVKTRSSDKFASPLAAVDLRKQRQIIRTAKVYRKLFRVNQIKFRYDVVSIVLIENSRPKIELFKGFWTEDKFYKKVWFEDF